MDIDKIYNTDCLVGMRDIPDSSIDAIICDLPYGTTKNRWDSIIPIEDLWMQYKRVIKPRGAIVLFAQMPFVSKLVESNPKMFKYEWIWVKDNSTGFLNCSAAPLKQHENILVFSEGCASFSRGGAYNMPYYPVFGVGKPYSQVRHCKSNNYDAGHMSDKTITISDGRRYPTDVLYFKTERGLHTTQKPVALIEYLLRTYTKPGELVLDNCMGSGTTAVACINTHRHYIGFEKEEKYYDIAQKRIEKILTERKQNLFSDEEIQEIY